MEESTEKYSRILNIIHYYIFVQTGAGAERPSTWLDILTSMAPSDIQWYSILITLIIICILSMLSLLMMCNQADGVQKQLNWMRMGEDALSPPHFKMLLSVFVGSGIQVLLTVLFISGMICFGSLSSSTRADLMTLVILWFHIYHFIAGYFSNAIYKNLGGKDRFLHVSLTGLLHSGITCGLLFMAVRLSKGTSAYAIFLEIFNCLDSWLYGSFSLTFIGSFFGSCGKVIENQCSNKKISKQIPKQGILRKPISGIVMGGILPFGCIFIQLYFVLNGLWSTRNIDSLLFSLLMLTVICSESTILLCYSHLSAGDYRWWWRSFFTSGSVAAYVFIYSLLHFFNTSHIIQDLNSTLGYTFIVAIFFFFFLMTGSIGFLACFWFVHKIYDVSKETSETNKMEEGKDLYQTICIIPSALQWISRTVKSKKQSYQSFACDKAKMII